MRVTWRAAVWVVIFAACSGCATLSPQPTAGKPNIVLVMADDQGWGDVAYNGHPVLKTPNLDAMAKAGLRFDRFYAAAPVCSPTRASVLTGRHPNRFGCFSWGHTLRPQEITVAEALRTAGYTTGHFGKWHVGSAQAGSPVNPSASGFDEWLSAPNFFDNDPILSREGKAVPWQGESSLVTVDAAMDFIRTHKDDAQPFLAVVWFGSPHRPHRALKEDRALYPGESEKLQHLYGEITAMDRAIGKLRDGLRQFGLRENTVLWYCSDNGGLPEGGSTGGRGHKGDLYEGGLRVPAVLEWPAVITEPRTTPVPSNTSDIYPTLLSIAGVTLPDQPPLDGVDLSPLIRGEPFERARPMGFWSYPARGVSTPSDKLMAAMFEAQQRGQTIGHPELLRPDASIIPTEYPTDHFPGHAAWLDWPWKLHRIESDDGVVYELYDLARDPMERDNVISDQSTLAEQLQRDLARWQESVLGSLNGAGYE